MLGCVTYAWGGEQCIDYRKYLHHVGEYSTGNVDQLLLVGTRCFQVYRPYSWFPTSPRLRILDFSDPSAPRTVSEMDVSADAPLGLDGRHLFLTSGNGLLIVDVLDGAHPRIVGSLALAEVPRSLAVANRHGFVALGAAGLSVLDLSDPTQAVVVSQFDTPGLASSVAIRDSRAFVSDGDAGLLTLDISDPGSPRPVARLDTRGAALSVAVERDHAFVLRSDSCLVVELSPASPPQIVASIGAQDPLRALAVRGTCLALATGACDGNEPGAPCYGEFRFVDVSNPVGPVTVGVVPALGSGVGVFMDGRYGYLQSYFATFGSTDHEARPSTSLEVVDILRPESPAIVASLAMPKQARAVAVSGRYAYVAGTQGGLQVVDVLDPARPKAVATADGMGWGNAIEVSGGKAFVAVGDAGLRIVDVGDPLHPVMLGSLDTPGHALSVDVGDSHAYIADVMGGLQVADISDPSNPTIVGTAPTWSALDVVVSGHLAYVAGSFAFFVVDVSSPDTPVVLATLEGFSNLCSVAVTGDRVVLAGGSNLVVVDVSQPTEPAIIGRTSVPGYAYRELVVGSIAYLATNLGVLAVDLWNPRAPSPLANVPLVSMDLAFDGEHLFVAGESKGLQILRPQCPRHAISSRRVFSRESEASLVLLPGLGPCHPNPMGGGPGSTNISFTLAQAAPARVRIFDVSGRLIRFVLDRALEPGRHSASWDGRDEHGGPVGAGIYFVRLDAGPLSESRAIVRLP